MVLQASKRQRILDLEEENQALKEENESLKKKVGELEEEISMLK